MSAVYDTTKVSLASLDVAGIGVNTTLNPPAGFGVTEAIGIDGRSGLPGPSAIPQLSVPVEV